MSAATKTNTETIMSACDDAFGLHPEDVIAPIKGAAELCHWLNEILKTIKEEAEQNGPLSHFRSSIWRTPGHIWLLITQIILVAITRK